MFSARYLAGLAILAATPNATQSHTGKKSCARVERLRRKRNQAIRNFHNQHPLDKFGHAERGHEYRLFDEAAHLLHLDTSDERTVVWRRFVIDLPDAIRKVLSDANQNRILGSTEPSKNREHELGEIVVEGLIRAFPFLPEDELFGSCKERIIQDACVDLRKYVLRFHPKIIEKGLFYACQETWAGEQVTSRFVWRCIFEQLIASCKAGNENTTWYTALERNEKRYLGMEPGRDQTKLAKLYEIARDEGESKEWVNDFVNHNLQYFGNGVDRPTMIENIHDHFVKSKKSLREVAEDYGFSK